MWTVMAGIARRLMCVALAASAMLAMAAAGSDVAEASPFNPSGVIHLLPRPPHLRISANRSSNWFGYNRPLVGEGGQPFDSISADWTVPRARPHRLGQVEQSATWIGIGGGCADPSCAVSDPTGLIQTGTEQDVGHAGRASYSAWWELVPAPAITIDHMIVRPGDRMHASITDVLHGGDVWRISLRDRTRHERFTTTVPYPSSHASAEWIEETPLAIGTGGVGMASLPALRALPFDHAMVNDRPADLRRSEQIQLYDGSTRIGTPSMPDADRDGFRWCTWRRTCPVPRSH
jgi:hypothetical protein